MAIINLYLKEALRLLGIHQRSSIMQDNLKPHFIKRITITLIKFRSRHLWARDYWLLSTVIWIHRTIQLLSLRSIIFTRNKKVSSPISYYRQWTWVMQRAWWVLIIPCSQMQLFTAKWKVGSQLSWMWEPSPNSKSHRILKSKDNFQHERQGLMNRNSLEKMVINQEASAQIEGNGHKQLLKLNALRIKIHPFRNRMPN